MYEKVGKMREGAVLEIMLRGENSKERWESRDTGKGVSKWWGIRESREDVSKLRGNRG